jgi:hypothetical protein
MKRAVVLIVLLLAFVVGIAGGLGYTWILDPIESYESAPHELRLEDKYVYLALIGDLYMKEGDLARAESRLADLGMPAEGPVLAGMIEDYLDAGGRPEEVRNLARLAETLGASGGVLNVFALEPLPSVEPTSTVAPEEVPSPTAAPTLTPAPTFLLAEQTAICAEPGKQGSIRVWVRDAAGNGMAGVEVVVSWNTGQDRFFTGLRPEQGAGYADFEMAPQVEYDVSLAGFRGDTAQGLSSDLSAGVCPTDTLALDWRLAFEQVP